MEKKKKPTVFRSFHSPLQPWHGGGEVEPEFERDLEMRDQLQMNYLARRLLVFSIRQP